VARPSVKTVFPDGNFLPDVASKETLALSPRVVGRQVRISLVAIWDRRVPTRGGATAPGVSAVALFKFGVITVATGAPPPEHQVVAGQVDQTRQGNAHGKEKTSAQQRGSQTAW